MFRIKQQVTASLFALSFLCVGQAQANGIISNPGRYDGGSLGVQTQTGTNCNSSAPDRASISAVAGNRVVDYNGSSINNGQTDLSAGIIFTLPIGQTVSGDCSKLLEMEEYRSRLDLAMTLFEAGAMTPDEIKELSEEIKQYIKN